MPSPFEPRGDNLGELIPQSFESGLPLQAANDDRDVILDPSNNPEKNDQELKSLKALQSLRETVILTRGATEELRALRAKDINSLVGEIDNAIMEVIEGSSSFDQASFVAKINITIAPFHLEDMGAKLAKLEFMLTERRFPLVISDPLNQKLSALKINVQEAQAFAKESLEKMAELNGDSERRRALGASVVAVVEPVIRDVYEFIDHLRPYFN